MRSHVLFFRPPPPRYNPLPVCGRTNSREGASLLGKIFGSPVAGNAASLYVIHFANYFLPLVTFPYLLRVLGPTGFGLVVFGQSLIGYFMIFVDYGFTYSATRKISVERDDPIAVSRTAFSVWAAKAAFCAAGLAVLLILVGLIPALRKEGLLMLVLYGVVVGNAIFPAWLFQGMERMFPITAISTSLKTLMLAAIFVLVRKPEHYVLYAAILSIGTLASGMAGAIVAAIVFRLRFVPPTIGRIRDDVAEGWMIFLSTASTSLYTAGNGFILGLIAGPTIVGYYGSSEKIVKACAGLVSPISQAAYPRFAKTAAESKESALKWGGRMLLMMAGAGLLISAAVFAGAPAIVRTVFGAGYEPSISAMRIMAAVPTLVSCSNVLGVQIMYSFKMEREAAFILLAAGSVNILLALLLVPCWQAGGMAASVTITEAFVVAGFLFRLWKKGLLPFGRGAAASA